MERVVNPPRGGGGRGDLVPTVPGCVSKSEGHGSFFSFKGVKFAASLNMRKNLCWVLYIMSYNLHKLYKNSQKMMDRE